MKQTVKVSISARVFELDMESYSMLEDYLGQMSVTLGTMAQKAEIISGIEADIAGRLLDIQAQDELVDEDLLLRVFNELGYVYVPSAEKAPEQAEATKKKKLKVISFPRFLLFSFLILLACVIALSTTLYYDIFHEVFVDFSSEIDGAASIAIFGVLMFLLIPVLIGLFTLILPACIALYLIYRLIIWLSSKGNGRFTWLIIVASVALLFYYLYSELGDKFRAIKDSITTTTSTQIINQSPSVHRPSVIIDADTVVTQELDESLADSVRIN